MSSADGRGRVWPLLQRVMPTSLAIQRDVTEPPKEAAGTFEALYNQYFDFVWRNLLRMGVDPSWVEDAAQDTFVVVHRRFADLQPTASPSAFLYGVALRVARDYRRRVRRKGTDALNTETTISADAGPFDHAANAEAARFVETFLGTLDEDK